MKRNCKKKEESSKAILKRLTENIEMNILLKPDTGETEHLDNRIEK